MAMQVSQAGNRSTAYFGRWEVHVSYLAPREYPPDAAHDEELVGVSPSQVTVSLTLLAASGDYLALLSLGDLRRHGQSAQ